MITWRQTVFVMGFASVAGAQTDPRVGLAGGHYVEAADASSNLELIAHKDRPKPFFNPSDPGDFNVINSDLAFRDNLVFQGNFYGIQIWNVRGHPEPGPENVARLPGGQGDPSVYGNLMFMSVETPNGRVDCGTQGVEGHREPRSVPRRSDLRHQRHRAPEANRRRPNLPRLAHAHAGSPTPRTRTSSGSTSRVSVPPRVRRGRARRAARVRRRSKTRTPRCSASTSFRCRSHHPQDAKVVCRPAHLRLNGQSTVCGRAANTAQARRTRTCTDQCHDITAYPAIGLAAGACSGNGILLDITQPGRAEAHRRRQRSELRLLALGDVQQRRQEGDLHGRVGRRCRTALPRERSHELGRGRDLLDRRRRQAPARRLLQDAGRADARRRTASRTTAR